jgi:aspartate ammonia-lyase
MYRRKSRTNFSKIIVDPYQGGAGTSLNMNINDDCYTALSYPEKFW